MAFVDHIQNVAEDALPAGFVSGMPPPPFVGGEQAVDWIIANGDGDTREVWWADDIHAANYLAPLFFYREEGGDVSYHERCGLWGLIAAFDMTEASNFNVMQMWENAYAHMENRMVESMLALSANRRVMEDGHHTGDILRMQGEITPILYGQLWAVGVAIYVDIIAELQLP